MDTNQIGIEKLKTGVAAAVNIVEIFIALIRNFSWQNAISQLSKIVFDIGFYQSVIRDAALIWKEAKDTDTGEAYELYAHFKSEFDIENDDQERKIERALEIAPMLYDAISRIIPAWNLASAPGLTIGARTKAIGRFMSVLGITLEEVGGFLEGEEEDPILTVEIPKLKAAA